MNKKRILLIQNCLSYGGTSSLILFIAKNLSDKYVFDLFCFEDNAPDKEKEFLSYGGEIIKSKRINYNQRGLVGRLISYSQRLFGKITREFTRLIKNRNYYAVHSFEDFSSGYYLKASKKVSINKRIVHFNVDHSVVRATNVINWFLLKKEIRLIKKYATVFAGGSMQAIPLSISKAKETIIINNPIDQKFVFDSNIPNNLCLLQVGTFNDNKNQLFSIKILDSLVHNYGLSDAKLVMVGQQPEKEKSYFGQLLEAIEEHNLTNNVVIKNAVNHPEQLYKENSVLVFPSKKEAFGLVLIEAQACGMHCFSSAAAAKDTDLGGVYFHELEEGPKKWADEIFNFYKSVEYAKKRFDTKKFSSENIKETYLSIYEKD